ncbi:MAG: tetratricopeptide repeat protein [Gammaproteobacteria bacterium]|nr:tetratricopeptide repeat protein [Gammaproteobacteria bacterium]
MIKQVIILCCFLLISGCQTVSQSVRTGNTLIEDQDIADKAYSQGNYSEAERAYRRMTIDSPQDSYNWFKLGNIYAKTNRPEEAKKTYKEALIRDPDHAKSWHNLGVIQLREAALSFIRVKHNSKSDTYIYQHSEQILGLLEEVIEIGEE